MYRRVKREKQFWTTRNQTPLGVGGVGLCQVREGVVMVLVPGGHPARGAKKAWSLAESPAGQEGNCEAAARATSQGESQEQQRQLKGVSGFSSEVGGKESTVEQKACDLCREQRAGTATAAGGLLGGVGKQCAPL